METLLMDEKLLIVTADKIGDTGTVSFKFIFDSKMPRDLVVETYNKPYGYVWQPDLREPIYAINVWESGRGVVLSGGWSPGNTDDFERDMAESIPASTLLMRTEVFDWLEKTILTPHGITFKRFHAEHTLLTN